MNFWGFALLASVLLFAMLLDTGSAGSIKTTGFVFDKEKRDIDVDVKPTSEGFNVRYWEISKPFDSIGSAIGRGYDLISGCPKSVKVGGDPGYRLPIFQIDQSKENVVADWRYLKPDHISVHSKISCSTKKSETVVTSSTELQTEMSTDVSTTNEFSAEASISKESKGKKMEGGLEASLAFTNSETNSELTNSLEAEEKELLITEATCSVYEAYINKFDLPKFDTEFMEAVGKLPATYTSSAKPIYAEFVKTYGTHVVIKALMGAKYGKVYEISSKTVEDMKEKSKEKSSEREIGVSVSASMEKEGKKGADGKKGDDTSIGGELGYNNGKKETTGASEMTSAALSNLASNEWTYAVGARPADDEQEWASEAAHDPVPIKIEVEDLSELVFAHVDKAKGLALRLFLSEYHPKGAVSPRHELGRCLVNRASHLVLSNHKAKRSIISKCPPGYEVVGGAFHHLWNYHGDVTVNAHAAELEELKKQVAEYQKLRNQEQEVKFIMKKGARMLKDFSKEKIIRDLENLFGDRVNPVFISKFLSGKLNSIGIQKRQVLSGIANGLKVFGNTQVSNMVEKFLGKNPYTKAIFKVSDSLVKHMKQVDKAHEGEKKKGPTITVEKTLAVDDTEMGEFISSKRHHHAIREHVDTLAAVFDELDKSKASSSEEAETEFFQAISDWVKKATEHIGKHVNRLFGAVSGGIDAALKVFEHFTASVEDLKKRYKAQIDAAKNRHVNNDMFQDLMKQVHEEPEDIHGKVLLAQRNSLSWMFPHKKNLFVCGSGNLGMKPTRRSSFGYCSSLCCKTKGQWNIVTEVSSHKKINRGKKEATIETRCPAGYSVLSGGIMKFSYKKNRFTQVTEMYPKDDDVWVCKIKWTETDYIQEVPNFKCYARCARAPKTKPHCSTQKQTLVNGHGTVYCPSTQMAVGGGWSVSSPGITYLKQTKYSNIHRGEGPRSFRVELGTSHIPITGTAYARCCDVSARGTEEIAVTNQRKCKTIKNYFNNVGSAWKFHREFGWRDVLMSQNKKFFMRMLWNPREDVNTVKLGVFESQPCHRDIMLDSIDFPLESCMKELEQIIEQRAKMPKIHRHPFFRRISRLTRVVKRIRHSGIRRHLKKRLINPMKRLGLRIWKRLRKARRFRRPNLIKEVRASITENGLRFRLNSNSNETKYCAYAEMAKEKLSYIRMGDNGDVGLYDDKNKVLSSYRFSQCRLMWLQQNSHRSVLENGEMLSLDQSLVSANKLYIFKFEVGGAISLYYQRAVGNRWCVKPKILETTAAYKGRKALSEFDMIQFNHYLKTGWTLRLNEDNNLVMSDQHGKKIWESGTAGQGFGPATLQLTNRGRLQLVDALERTIWTLRKGKISDCELLRETLKLRSNKLGVGQTFDAKAGGLLSENKEYVLHVRKNGAESSLEIWKDGSRADCTMSRICTLANNVDSVSIKKDGIHVTHGSSKRVLYKMKKGVLKELMITHAGHLVAVGAGTGEQANRVTHYEPVKLGSCRIAHQVKIQDQKQMDPNHCGSVLVRGKFGAVDHWASCPKGYHLNGFKPDHTVNLVGVPFFSCCKDQGAEPEDMECKTVDWGSTMAHAGTPQCPPGYVLNGLFTKGTQSTQITKVRCCRNTKRTPAQQSCTKESKTFKAGEKVTCSRPRTYLAGFHRTSACGELNCIKSFVCCSL